MNKLKKRHNPRIYDFEEFTSAYRVHDITQNKKNCTVDLDKYLRNWAANENKWVISCRYGYVIPSVNLFFSIFEKLYDNRSSSQKELIENIRKHYQDLFPKTIMTSTHISVVSMYDPTNFCEYGTITHHNYFNEFKYSTNHNRISFSIQDLKQSINNRKEFGEGKEIAETLFNTGDVNKILEVFEWFSGKTFKILGNLYENTQGMTEYMISESVFGLMCDNETINLIVEDATNFKADALFARLQQ